MQGGGSTGIDRSPMGLAKFIRYSFWKGASPVQLQLIFAILQLLLAPKGGKAAPERELPLAKEVGWMQPSEHSNDAICPLAHEGKGRVGRERLNSLKERQI